MPKRHLRLSTLQSLILATGSQRPFNVSELASYSVLELIECCGPQNVELNSEGRDSPESNPILLKGYGAVVDDIEEARSDIAGSCDLPILVCA